MKQIEIKMKKRLSVSRKLFLWRSFSIASTGIFIIYISLRDSGGQSSSKGISTIRTPPVPTFKLRWDLGHILEKEGMTSGVELGVQRGIFSAEILDRWPSCKRYVLVDLWTEPNAFKPEVDQRLSNYTNRVNIEPCQDFTTTCAKKYAGQQFDYIYVDARHDYKGVLEDLEAWWDLLRPGGIFAGHDYMSAADVPPEITDDWSVNYDGTIDPLGRAVKGAVDEFANKHSVQLTVGYHEPLWSTWAMRKPL